MGTDVGGMSRIVVFYGQCHRCMVKWTHGHKTACPRCDRTDYCAYLEDFKYVDKIVHE